MNKPQSRPTESSIAMAIAVSVAIGLVGSSAAFADMMTKPEYTQAKQNIGSEFKSDKAHCGLMSGNTKDVCLAEANARESIAKAELESTYKPSVKATRDASNTAAEARYAVAKQKCQPNTGNNKDVCIKEAELVRTKALADAKETKKEVDALNTAGDKKDKANSNADKTISDARTQSVHSTHKAEYKLAIEKCDDFSGNQKSICVNNAKTKYGK